ncbi:MAG: ATP-binding protein [Firmicutes bacterium]|nr:ATP-binding protein [Bacillota bacterium]
MMRKTINLLICAAFYRFRRVRAGSGSIFDTQRTGSVERLRHAAQRRFTMILTGEPGVSKSTILRRLHMTSMFHATRLSTLTKAEPQSAGFAAICSGQLGVEMPFRLAKVRALASTTLFEGYDTHKRTPVLILDEAQKIPGIGSLMNGVDCSITNTTPSWRLP